jgi:hypothetical protein
VSRSAAKASMLLYFCRPRPVNGYDPRRCGDTPRTTRVRSTRTTQRQGTDSLSEGQTCLSKWGAPPAHQLPHTRLSLFSPTPPFSTKPVSQRTLAGLPLRAGSMTWPSSRPGKAAAVPQAASPALLGHLASSQSAWLGGALAGTPVLLRPRQGVWRRWVGEVTATPPERPSSGRPRTCWWPEGEGRTAGPGGRRSPGPAVPAPLPPRRQGSNSC